MRDLISFLIDLFSFDKEHPLLFTQFNFWAFFLLVFAGFCLIQRSCRKGRLAGKDNKLTFRNGYLFIVSLFFYFKTSGLFVLLLVFSTFLGYYLGIWMDKQQERDGWRRKALMITGVAINLLVLFYFKYAYFFTTTSPRRPASMPRRYCCRWASRSLLSRISAISWMCTRTR